MELERLLGRGPVLYSRHLLLRCRFVVCVQLRLDSADVSNGASRLRHVSNGMAGLPFTATTITDSPANREDAQEIHSDGGDKDWILNRQKCYVNVLEGKGRGVFASQAIPAQTLIETSPVLLFTKEEYEDHGRHTLLDHYTFTWRDGRMALALGLGSLFNHSGQPNVSFSIDSARECITYTSARVINLDEELCIFYGHKLWFDPVDDIVYTSNSQRGTSELNDEADPWGGLARIQGNTADLIAGTPTKLHRKIDELVEEGGLPFTWKKLALQKEEEHIDDIELVQAWVVDIPEQKHTATMLKWLKQSGLDGDSLSHLKRIRRQGPSSSLLLDTSQVPPGLPPGICLGAPYQLPIPCHPALTETSLRLKNTFWPTVFAPKRKWEPERWTWGKIRWASDAMNHLKKESVKATTTGELPIVAYVPIPYEDDAQLSRPFVAHDTRTSTRHPLRHAALNVIRKVADFRARQLPAKAAQEEASKNGTQYLLTGLSLFITHEPCIMCAMALLHSRVKEVFYLVPMPKTGGCGGAVCVPSLKGVNHRFSIGVWKHSLDEGHDLPAALASEIDA
ncbi:hypothetical protein PAXRUDRAFT_827152 [Paxillus rubicundulus Ve08.2h10]|uniref:Uncharacterized protein n=1 Tax=Paxillus rubicundulus Ve08.2h10 TaxID=930991 RepID=A0A0D0E392_9AGAM|nr:hypothetical protein PAXRUDRAFT_827152 [Paxillus rubicundulus Ve08.2h10]